MDEEVDKFFSQFPEFKTNKAKDFITLLEERSRFRKGKEPIKFESKSNSKNKKRKYKELTSTKTGTHARNYLQLMPESSIYTNNPYQIRKSAYATSKKLNMTQFRSSINNEKRGESENKQQKLTLPSNF